MVMSPYSPEGSLSQSSYQRIKESHSISLPLNTFIPSHLPGRHRAKMSKDFNYMHFSQNNTIKICSSSGRKQMQVYAN
jgi:phosphoserine aminotransferase